MKTSKQTAPIHNFINRVPAPDHDYQDDGSGWRCKSCIFPRALHTAAEPEWRDTVYHGDGKDRKADRLKQERAA